MTVRQAIEGADGLFPNSFDAQHKLRWLSQLDAMVRGLIVDVREGAPDAPYRPYGEADMERQLTMPDPFGEAYIYWLAAKMDFVNGETGLYNNKIAQFSAAMEEFTAWYGRGHAVKSGTAIRLP